MKYEIVRDYKSSFDPVGTEYDFPIGKVTLIHCLDYDYGYCYQGIVLRYNDKLYYGQFVGPYGNEVEKENVIIYLHKQMKLVQGKSRYEMYYEN